LITGATGAIGAALAREYAAPGVTLFLHGRNAQRLQEVAADCQAKGSQAVITRFDVRSASTLIRRVSTSATGFIRARASITSSTSGPSILPSVRVLRLR